MNNYKRINNRRGYTIFLLMILFLMIIFWRLGAASSELINYMKYQKLEMKDSGIILDQSEIITFELN